MNDETMLKVLKLLSKNWRKKSGEKYRDLVEEDKPVKKQNKNRDAQLDKIVADAVEKNE